MLTLDQMLDRMSSDDPFRIVIRGQAAIEENVHDGIKAAFDPDAADRTLRSISGFERRLDLAIALGILRSEHRAPLVASAQLRNEVAHGADDADLSMARARVLADAINVVVQAAIGSEWRDRPLNVGDLLRGCYVFAFTMVQIDLQRAEERRHRIDEALEQLAINEALRAAVARSREAKPDAPAE